jgi:hypothetical protein
MAPMASLLLLAAAGSFVLGELLLAPGEAILFMKRL